MLTNIEINNLALYTKHYKRICGNINLYNKFMHNYNFIDLITSGTLLQEGLFAIVFGSQFYCWNKVPDNCVLLSNDFINNQNINIEWSLPIFINYEWDDPSDINKCLKRMLNLKVFL